MNIQTCRTCGDKIPAGRKKYCNSHPNERVKKQQEKELRHIESGMCKSCTQPLSENSTVFCDNHLKANRGRGVRDREKRRKAGICRSCSEPRSSRSKTWCEIHRIQQNELSLKLSRSKRAQESCMDCGNAPRLFRKRRCTNCQESYNMIKTQTCRRIECNKPTEIKYFCREHANEENAKLRNRRANLRRKKKCIFCFSLITSKTGIGYVLCDACRAKQRIRRSSATA